MTVGTLYYHLEILDDLIIQNHQRKYLLSEKGKAAKKLLEKGAELQSVGAVSSSQMTTLNRVLKELFLAPSVFKAISEKPLLYMPAALSIVALSAYFFEQARIEPTFLLYVTQSTQRSLSFVLGEVLLAWAGLFILAEVCTYLLYRRLGGEGALLIGIPFSLLPALVLPIILTIGGNLGLTPATFSIVFLLLQAWTFLLLTALVALVKGLPVEKGAVVTLILVFAILTAYTVYLA